ncbi:MAG TPA: YfhO family protein [Candidatus Eisenbacteria bacterium]|nr:YfhO family protein [Candidatus Eisenbacteria bacterium]
MSPAKKKAGARPVAARGAGRAGSMRPADSPDLKALWAYALLAGLVLLFFYPITFGKVFVSPDSVAPAGFVKVADQALQTRHVYPLWNPYTFLGMPSFGSLAFVPYAYPPDPIFGFLNVHLGFPDLTWLLAHYLLLGFSMYAFLRAFGTSRGPSILGALTLALTPNLVAVGAFGHGSQIMTASYLPLLLLLYDRFARRGSWLALSGFAIAASFQLLRGHVQIVFYSWLALGLYALVLAVDAFRSGRRGEGLRAIGGLAGGLALAFGLSAFLYLPVHEYSKLSTRGGGEGGGAGLAYATSWSFHPREILTFILPGFFGFGGATYWGSMPFTDYPNYMGIVALVLAIYGAASTRGRTRTYLIVLAVVALLVSFGKHFQPLYALLYYHLPFFNKFRVPVMILVLVQFAVAALAALGLDRALSPERQAPGKDPGSAWMRGALLALAGGFGLLVALNALGPMYRSAAMGSRQGFDEGRARAALDLASTDALKAGLLLAAALFVIGLARRGRLSRAGASLLVILIAVVDLWPVDRKIIDPQVGTPVEYDANFKETPEIAFLRSDSTQFRVFPLQWNDSRLAAFGIASVLGYHPAKPYLYQAFVDTVGIQSFGTLEMLNVKYVLADGYFPPETQGSAALRHDGEVKVYEILHTMPRASVIHGVRQVRDDGVALATMRTGGFDPHREILWSLPGSPPAVAAPSTPDSVRTLRYDFNDIEYFVSTTAPGVFLTIEQYDPDWKAFVDGKPVPIERVNYFMRGVPVTPGVHHVRYQYEPKALAEGIKISIASAVIAALIGLWGVKQLVDERRRRRASEAPVPPAPEGAAG